MAENKEVESKKKPRGKINTTGSANKKKKKETDKKKVIVIIFTIIIGIIIIIVGISSALSPDTTSKNQPQDVLNKVASGTDKNDNTVDENKLNQDTEDNKKQKGKTTQEIAQMTKEEREAYFKNSINNKSDENPDASMSEQEKKNRKYKLGFNAEQVNKKYDFFTYEKCTTKMADRTFKLWLKGTYNDKPYNLNVTAEIWDDLKDKGIVPVEVEYFIDTNNCENVLSIKVRDDYKDVTEDNN